MHIQWKPIIVCCAVVLGCDTSEPENHAETHQITAPADHAAITFVAVKDGGAQVEFTGSDVTGEVAIPNGDMSQVSGEISIQIAALTSGSELRDQRVHDIFFAVTSVSQATYTFTTAAAEEVGPGLWHTEVTGELALVGTSHEYTMELEVAEVGDGYRVQTREPLVVSIEDFRLGDNLSALMAECGHNFIDDAVTVEVDVMLD